jgi:hypothetical protein
MIGWLCAKTVLRLAELSESDCKRFCKALCLDQTQKEDLARCSQISYPMRSWLCGSMHVKILEETNKRGEELVDVSPR